MAAVESVSQPQQQAVYYPRYARSEELGSEITELCGHSYAATFKLLVMIREFDQHGLWKLDGICSSAHWLNYRCGIGMNAAREKVRVTNALGAPPKISALFEKGELSYSKVRAMTRVATEDNEDFLLNIAHHGTAHQGTAHHMETLVSKYSRARRLHENKKADEQYQDRSLKYYYDDDGSFVIKGRFPAEQGALILKAFQSAVDQNDASSAASGSGDTVDHNVDNAAETPGLDVTAEARAPYSARRADALAGLAETYLANGPAKSSSADRYQVMLHVSAETLRGEPAVRQDHRVTAETPAPLGEDISHIDDGPHVSAETSRRMCALKLDAAGALE